MLVASFGPYVSFFPYCFMFYTNSLLKAPSHIQEAGSTSKRAGICVSLFIIVFCVILIVCQCLMYDASCVIWAVSSCKLFSILFYFY